VTRPAKAPAKRRGGGPSRHGLNLGHQVSLRAADAAEAERWAMAAADAGVSRTEWMRAVLNGAATAPDHAPKRKNRPGP